MAQKWGLEFLSKIIDRNKFTEIPKKEKLPKKIVITSDEQLFPTKARCRFKQYVFNKPDKLKKDEVRSSVPSDEFEVLILNIKGENMSRKDSIFQLANELTSDHKDLAKLISREA
ncbi:piggyBac transposable element-derived protein 4-like [Vespula squamosa]|uniref:PiggyBac transposable element-derived protein 4-like n=1 Tax=Vespula squamosa TaxID=30214 RepID=A0ABD2BXU6_VESSQ